MLKIYISKDYNTVASNTRFTNDFIPKRVKIIGNQLSEKTLPSGNTIHIHLLPQDSLSSGGSSFRSIPGPGSIFSTGIKKKQRFDIYAFLVNKDDTIIDYGHGRYNTTKTCGGSVIFVNYNCSTAEITGISSEVEGIVMTSKNLPISSWKKYSLPLNICA